MATKISSAQKPDMYLLLSNISKKANVRALLSIALAFGCKRILVVGQKSYDFEPDGADIPRAMKDPMLTGRISIQRFGSWDDCMKFLKQRNIRLIGVEIHREAKCIDEFFDIQDTAFLLGNEGQGLNERQLASCDGFVRIPQYGGGTASLNVYVAASIILHRFHHWQRELVSQQSKHGASI